jgi:hypothetical protein
VVQVKLRSSLILGNAMDGRFNRPLVGAGRQSMR